MNANRMQKPIAKLTRNARLRKWSCQAVNDDVAVDEIAVIGEVRARLK